MSESAAAKSKPSLTRELAQHLEALKLGGDGKKPEKKRPNKHTDRAAWNAHFEREIAVQLASSLASSKRSVSLPSDGYADTARHFEGSDIMDLNQQLALTIKEMIEREGSLIAFALDKMVYANFEADWATLGSNKKKELVLEGLYRGACAAPRDNSRVVCPEMTVNGLAGDGEHNLIRLVKRLIEHDPTGSGRVKSLFLYPHPYINDERYTEGAPDFTRAMFYQSNLFRTYYIIETLRGVMEAYYKIAAEPITIAKTAGHHCPHKRAPEEQPCCPGPDALNDAGRRVDQSQCKEEAAVAVYACYSCNRVKDRDALKSCGKCRLVRYCSG
ncbi:hypothetical protein B0H19DRAFT_178981 [Mycena capillaripes]|nr:hypothetical protein B0H19DRAFT_178981 [Mycena capillaripes]